MKGPRLFDHTDWKKKKRCSRPPNDVLFSLKISLKSKKKFLFFVIRPLILSEAPHFLGGPRLQSA